MTDLRGHGPPDLHAAAAIAEAADPPVFAPRRAGGMSRRTARSIEYTIIVLCVVSLVFIVQPFSMGLYGIGAGLVVLGGLAFNLVPLCRPGVRLGFLVRVGLIVLLILAIVIALALGFTELYAVYLESS